MGRQPELMSVIIPVLNGAETLPLQLDALAAQTYRGAWEVLVVDNGATDGSAELALRWAGKLPRLRVLAASERRGSNYARNVGAAAARGDFLVFCDADDVATPRWLAAMAEAATKWELVGGVLDREVLNDAETRSWYWSQPSDKLPTALGFLPYACSSNMGVRTAVFHELGGWNEDYSAAGDDIEFCWRAQLSSRRLGFAPQAVMLYRYRRDLRALARQMYRYGLAEPRLYGSFRHRGMPRSSARKSWRAWAKIARHLPELRSPTRRGIWVREAAYRWGRIRGSVRHRVLYL